MIKYSRGILYTMECHITPPPHPSTKVLQKNSDISNEYPEYFSTRLKLILTALCLCIDFGNVYSLKEKVCIFVIFEDFLS